MIILVYGDDGFRAQERVRELREAFVKKHDPTGMNLAVFPADGQTAVVPGEALQAACSLPFLAQKRLVIVRGVIAGIKKDAEKLWLEGIKRIPDSTILLFWESAEPAAIEKTALFKELKGTADVHFYPYPALEGAALAKWIGERATAYGAKIAPDAVRALMERVGADLWQINGELGKLAAFAGAQLPPPLVPPPAGGNTVPTITAVMVRDLVRASFEGQIFALVDAISRREPREALRLLEQERRAGADDHYLLSMLARQIRLLLSARSLLDTNPRATSAEAAEALGAHAFVAGKVLTQARAFSFDDLRRTHDLLYTYDIGLKSGRIGADLATDLTVVELLRT